ncbi:MAG TPA: PD-(D/E)XK nuclease family protein [Aquabacterium sp.]|nr:PD-(D/E)XK nuclease family protein [Aquabacterium sp.]
MPQGRRPYKSCGRRFLYTHLLQVGGRRRMSAFMLMHEAIRDVYRAVIAQGAASAGQCEALLAEAFVIHGLHDHGYVEDYRAMASSMLGYFLESRAGALVEAPTALRITFDNHEVEVRPDEVLVRDGVRTLRRVKTGHATSQEGKDVGAAAFILAARAAFPDAVVELVYLADAEAKPLVLSARELSGRQAKLGNILRDIRSGTFPAEASDMTCPNCPAFFVCGALPQGTLVKAF